MSGFKQGNLIVEDGRYKMRRSKEYISNFTMRLLYLVEVRSSGSGYVGVAMHKVSTEK